MAALKIILMFSLSLGLAAASVPGIIAARADNPLGLSPREQLGKFLFYDRTLSARRNQSCATCHAPESGWAGGNEVFNRTGGVYEGSISGRFGNRKPPSAAYATLAPRLRLMHPRHAMFVGGNFWDGRATGDVLGNPAADQAQGPFLNPVEQALPDAKTLVHEVCTGDYAPLFKTIWGADACDDVDRAYAYVARSIADYEASAEVNAFSSKYDAFLAGRATLTPQEDQGRQLFAGKGRCATCHPHRRTRTDFPPLFTDFTFENLGIPPNPGNPYYADPASNPAGHAWRDEGLGGFLRTVPAYASHAASQLGRHRVPTLRNVDRRPHPGFVKAYGHNGYFKSLEAIVHFYNTRDLLPRCRRATDTPGVECWPDPEISDNINRRLVGSLGLTRDEEAAIVAFLGTLSDGYVP